MKFPAAICGALVLIAAPAHAKEQIGDGGDSCGTWTTKPTGAQKAWVYGYLSRATFNYAGEILGPVDAGAIIGWIDNYCKAHPLERIASAAGALEIELAKKTTPKASPRK